MLKHLFTNHQNNIKIKLHQTISANDLKICPCSKYKNTSNNLYVTHILVAITGVKTHENWLAKMRYRGHGIQIININKSIVNLSATPKADPLHHSVHYQHSITINHSHPLQLQSTQLVKVKHSCSQLHKMLLTYTQIEAKGNLFSLL